MKQLAFPEFDVVESLELEDELVAAFGEAGIEVVVVEVGVGFVLKLLEVKNESA